MEKMIVKVKKLHPDAVLPKQATDTDAGYDMVAIDDGVWDANQRFIEYDTGIAVEPPSGYHSKISARSSISKFDLVLCNGEGLIDNSYRNSIKFRFKPVYTMLTMGPAVGFKVPLNIFKKGDKIGQIKIEKTYYADFEEVDTLSQTERGLGGFGSSDIAKKS
jgi:dUTP pyrophosphatase